MKIFKYLNILNSKEKIGFLIYFLIFYFSYFFELMGISLILPLLSKNNTQDFFLDNSNFEFIFSFIKNFNSSEILIFMICLIIFKNIFLILANFFNQFLYYKLKTRIGNDVFYYYINLEYEKLLKNKIHTISRKITSEVPIFIDNLVRKIDFLSSLILLSLYLAFGIIIFDGSIYFIIPVLVFFRLPSWGRQPPPRRATLFCSAQSSSQPHHEVSSEERVQGLPFSIPLSSIWLT